MREVLTPLREGASDYAEFMAEALNVLSEVEERPPKTSHSFSVRRGESYDTPVASWKL